MAIFVRDRNFYRTMLAIGVPVVLQSAITIGDGPGWHAATTR